MEGTNPTPPAAGEQNGPKPPTKLVDTGKPAKKKAAARPAAAVIKAPTVKAGDTINLVVADGTVLEAEVDEVADPKAGLINIELDDEVWGKHTLANVPYDETAKKPETWHEAE